MSTIEKLFELLKRFPCDVCTIEINEHRWQQDKIDKYLHQIYLINDDGLKYLIGKSGIEQRIKKCVEANYVCEILVFPHGRDMGYKVFAESVEACADWIINILQPLIGEAHDII